MNEATSHRNQRDDATPCTSSATEWPLTALLFGSIGAITWAIRGTDGWGGIDGTIVPGMIWGLLWYYLCRRKGIDARAIPLWLGLGIALGGELGYGQYVSWIQGRFAVGEGTLPLAPWVGYLWFAICGIGWGAPGGIALGWALSGKQNRTTWLMRLAIPAAAGFLGWLAVRTWPWLFFPHYRDGLYAAQLGHHLERTVYTNTQNFTVVAWWAGAMLLALYRRDRATLLAGAVIGGGFGIAFPISAIWCLGYTYAPGYIDWWKMWELNAGFFLGILYTIVLYWAIRQAPAVPEALPPNIDRRRSLSLILSTFIFFFILFFGATSRTGVILELYDPKAVSQYQWPFARIILFIPLLLTVAAATAFSTYRVFYPTSRPPRLDLPERITATMMLIGLVGAITIWPSEIGVLYALFLALAICAFNRLNRHLDRVEQHKM